MSPEERVFTWLGGNKFLPLARRPLPFVGKTRVVAMPFSSNPAPSLCASFRPLPVLRSLLAVLLVPWLALSGTAQTVSSGSVTTLANPEFTIALQASNFGALEPCATNGVPEEYGWFLLQKRAQFRQTSSAVPTEFSPASAQIQLQPPFAFGVSNVIVAGPSSFKATLGNAGTTSLWSATYTDEATLNTTLAPGAWATTFHLSFTNGESIVGFFPFTVATAQPPVPQSANFEAAQAINPAATFTLTWTPWVGAGTNDYVGLSIVDTLGNAVVTAATDCSGTITLPTGATSVEIPAGALKSGSSYTVHLTFGAEIFRSTDEASLLVERGLQSRTTHFGIKTTGSSGGTPTTLTGTKIVGTNIVFTIEGTAGSSFTVQSTTDFAQWQNEVSGTIPAAGRTEVTVPLATSGAPRFYRVQSTGGGETPADPAQLGLALTGANQLTLTVQGTPGGRYQVQSTADYLTWTTLQEVAIPAGGTPVQVVLNIAAGVPFQAYRATSLSAPPPPAGKQPTLAIGWTGTALRLAVTGGDANRTYVFQSASPDLGTWTSTATTVTTDASGSGTATVTPSAANALYRALAQ